MKPEPQKDIERSVEPLLGGVALTPAKMAGEASLSRFHFQRVFKQIMGETPGELRRRILLERAARLLAVSNVSITEIAFDSGFETLEGFSRAFRKAYACTPSAYRSGAVRSYTLRSPNEVHFAAHGSPMPGGQTMDILDRLLEQDAWMTKKLLDEAAKLTDEELDRKVLDLHTFPWEPPQLCLRDLLDRIVLNREVWVAAVEKEDLPNERDMTPQGMRRRYEVSQSIFAGLARRVRDQDQWDTTFVDELCEPPETFTFAGIIEDVLTFTIFRRTLAFEALKKLGHDIGYGEPIDWERMRLAAL